MARGNYTGTGINAGPTCAYPDNRPCKRDAVYLINEQPCCPGHANLSLAEALARKDVVEVRRPEGARL